MRRNIRRILHRSLSIGIFILSAAASAFALDPNKNLDLFILDEWREGLPQNTVQSIVQSKDGYLWIATYEGLVRFDGIRFKVFARYNTPEIRSDGISTIIEDKRENLWIGTLGGGLIRYDKKSFTAYAEASGLPSGYVYAICESGDGSLWVGTNRGLSRFKDGKFTTYTTAQGLSNDFVRCLYEDAASNLWIGTGGGGICLFKEGRFTNYTMKEGLVSDLVYGIVEDDSGNLWVRTEGRGLNCLKKGVWKTYTTADGLSEDFIRSIYLDRQGVLWAGANGGGINRFKDEKFQPYKGKGYKSAVRSFCEDGEGSLWIGASNGLMRLREGKFTTYTTDQGLSDDETRAVFEDKSGNIWIGVDGKGLTLFKDGKFTLFTADDASMSYSIRTIAEDRRGTLWVGFDRGGLCRFKDGLFVDCARIPALTTTTVNALYVDRKDNLWIGMLGGGLALFKDGAFTFYTVGDGLPTNEINAISEDRDGGIWIGTRDAGLSLFKDGRFTNYTAKDGLSDDNVFCIVEDEKALWIGTNGGLSRLKNGRFAVCTPNNGLFDDTIFQILDDGKGFFWMSSNKGIFRVAKKQLNDFADGKIRAVESINYDKADGLQTLQCHGGSQPAAWRSRDGRLWFATIKGFVLINPDQIKINEQKPPVIIEDFIAGEKDYKTYEKVEFSPNQNSLEFHYTALSLIASEKVKFKYKLEGFDKNWIDAGGRRTAYYTNLDSGRYVFRVTACNNDGIWNESGASYGFYLPPPLWETWWAYGIYAIGFCSAIAGAYRYQINRIKQQARRREAKVKESAFNKILTSLSRVNISDPADLPGALETLSQTTAHALEVSRVGIWLYNEDASRLQCLNFFDSESGQHFKGLEVKASAFPSYIAALDAERVIAVEDAINDPRTKELAADYLAPLGIRSMLAAPILAGGLVRGVICCEHAGEIRHWNSHERDFALSVSNTAALALDEAEQKQLKKERAEAQARAEASLAEQQMAELRAKAAEVQARVMEVENERKGRELNFARQLQLSMLPKENLLLERVEVIGRMRTATEVGGDYYDIIKIDRNRYCAAIGDATGHGVGAGLVVGMVKMALLNEITSRPDQPLSEMLSKMSAALKSSLSQRGVGMCLCVALIDVEMMTAELCSTGLPNPYVYRKASDLAEAIPMPGPPLGILKKLNMSLRTFRLAPGDCLVTLTDGFTERSNATGELHGHKAVGSELLRICGEADRAETIVDAIFAASDRFAYGRENDDDMTALVIRINDSPHVCKE